MAGARRRSRVRDGNVNLQNLTAQTLPNAQTHTTRDAGSATAETAPSENNETTGANAPIPRATTAFCRKCGGRVGDFYNSWYRITGSYYLPALLGSYRSLLKSAGKRKAAAQGTILEKCTIQPLSCPAPSCTHLIVGFTVVDTTKATKKFQGRDLFKLSQLDLRCDTSPGVETAVEPYEESLNDTVHPEISDSPSPDLPDHSRSPSVDVMDVYQRMDVSRHNSSDGVHQNPKEAALPHQTGLGRPSLPTRGTTANVGEVASLLSDSKASLEASPAVVSAQDGQLASQNIVAESHGFPPPRVSMLKSQSVSSDHESVTNGHHYPVPPSQVWLDAIERLQTQISQNSGALSAHTRDIRCGEEALKQIQDSLRREFQAQFNRQNSDLRRIEDAVNRMHLDMQGIHQMMDAISRELQHTRLANGNQARVDHVTHVPPVSAQDTALELMAQQIAAMSQKANEVDALKLTIEILKNKVQRLEDGPPALPSQATPQHDHATALQKTQPPPALKTSARQYVVPPAGSPYADQQARPSPTLHHPHSIVPPTASTAVEASVRPESLISHSGAWTAVNAGSKRSFSNNPESMPGAVRSAPGSPKRRRTDMMGFLHDQTSTEHRAGPYDNLGAFYPPPTQTLSSQQAGSQPVQYVHLQMNTHREDDVDGGPSDDSGRLQIQNTIEHRPRGRGRGGGPGSRGGRGRKSLPAHGHMTDTSDWEQASWQGVMPSQSSPHEQSYSPLARRGIARRGSGGGGGRAGYHVNDRATSLGLHEHPTDFSLGSPGDPYSHTKKTRTKPTRNADGVLIRKDGRPDMRSQSSAANLRKVHARKEGDESHSPTAFTPTGLHHSRSVEAPDTPSPSTFAGEGGASPSVSKRHDAIMHKIFPSGLDESRRQNDFARQVFDEDNDHTVHPRQARRPSTIKHAPASTSTHSILASHTSSEQAVADTLAVQTETAVRKLHNEADGIPSKSQINSPPARLANGSGSNVAHAMAESEPIAAT